MRDPFQDIIHIFSIAFNLGLMISNVLDKKTKSMTNAVRSTLNCTKSRVFKESVSYLLSLLSVRLANARIEPLKEGKSTKGPNDVDSTTPRQPVTVWLERADRISARLRKITGDDPKGYLRRIVEEFLDTRDKDVVYEQIVTVGRLQKLVYGYEDEILTLAGLGPEFERVKDITRSVCDVIKWLEEVLCMVMVDAAEVETTYKACGFSFH